MKLRRFILSLAKKGYVRLSKIGNMIWIKTTPKLVDLIIKPFNTCKTQTPVKSLYSSKHPEQGYSKNTLLNNRIHPSRSRARRILAFNDSNITNNISNNYWLKIDQIFTVFLNFCTFNQKFKSF